MGILVGRSRPGRQSAPERLATRRTRRLQVFELVDHSRRHLCPQVRRRFDRAVASSSFPDDGVPDVLGKGNAGLPASLACYKRGYSILMRRWLKLSLPQLLWAQITAQTFMAPYSGDQVFSTLQRIFGTAVGLVYGMRRLGPLPREVVERELTCFILSSCSFGKLGCSATFSSLVALISSPLQWYIGAANGRGTSVGVGSSLFVLTLPVLAMRLHAPPASAMIAIMVTVTTVLVVGYSIIDTRLARMGNPGVGYNVAWRRGLLVIIGAVSTFLRPDCPCLSWILAYREKLFTVQAVGLVFMILPPANSTRKLVRRTHAKCLEQLGRVYAAITTLWVEEQRREDRLRAKQVDSFDSTTKNDSSDAAPFGQASQKAAQARMFAIRNKLNSTKVANLQAAFDLTFRGDWPQAEYFRLMRLQLALLQALAQLGLALARLEPEWRKQLVHQTAFLNQPLVSS